MLRRQIHNAAQCRRKLFPYLGIDVMVLYLQLVVRNWGILWKAITFLCGYLSLCGVVSSCCGVVSSLCLVVTSPCGLFIIWCGFVFMFCWLHFRYEALVPRLYSLPRTSQTGFKRGPQFLLFRVGKDYKMAGAGNHSSCRSRQWGICQKTSGRGWGICQFF